MYFSLSLSLSLSNIVSCEERGQIFKPCDRSCTYSCNNATILQLPHVCLSYCKPGCECPTRQVS